MHIDQAGWESQEPARASTRAAVANMTESERVRRYASRSGEMVLTVALSFSNHSSNVDESRVSIPPSCCTCEDR